MAGWLALSPNMALRAAGKAARLATSKVRDRKSDPAPDFSALGADGIETDRLLLQPSAMRDLDPLVRIFPSGQLAQRWSGRSPTPAWWDELGFVSDLANNAFSWTVVRKSDGTPIGVCALGWYAVEGFEGAELGYWIGAEYRGAGYATEAAKAALERCRRRLPTEHLASFIAPGNHASVRVAEKLGFRFRRQFVFRGGTTHLYAPANPGNE